MSDKRSLTDMQEALAALLGKDAPNLSPAVLARLKAGWQEEFERWKKRDLSARRYVYIWADGVYLQARMEHDKQCIFVLIGATPEGRKELIGFQVGYRESAQSWRELLADLKARGLTVPPKLAIGDGALGFWKALEEEFGATRQQRCWVHKTPSERLSLTINVRLMNVLNKLPKSMQPKAKADLKEIWMAEGRADAEKAFDRFLAKYEAKYDKAAACLAKDREALLAFYDFPAEHWKHIRTSNPIESTFATVRHRTTRAKGCLSHETGVIMVFKMIQTAQSSWRRLDGQNQLPKLITGVKFNDGIAKPAAETPPDQFQPGRHQDSRITPAEIGSGSALVRNPGCCCPSTACRVFQRIQARQRQLGSASVHRNPRREGYSPDGERRNAMHVTPS